MYGVVWVWCGCDERWVMGVMGVLGVIKFRGNQKRHNNRNADVWTMMMVMCVR